MFAGLIHDDVLRTPVLFLLLRFHRLVIPGNGNLWLLATEPICDEDVSLSLVAVMAIGTEENPGSVWRDHRKPIKAQRSGDLFLTGSINIDLVDVEFPATTGSLVG